MVQFVANVHNDIIPIDMLVGAAALARSSPLVADGLFAVAGLVKLPYLALGLPVLRPVRGFGPRVGGVLAAIAAALALSWFAGGGAYVSALVRHTGPGGAGESWRLVSLAAAVVLGAAFLGARRTIGALWLIPWIGAFELPVAIASVGTIAVPWILPWYLIWGLPYALARHRILGFLLVSFPFAGALVAPELLRVRVLLVVALATLAVLVWRWFAPPRGEAPSLG